MAEAAEERDRLWRIARRVARSLKGRGFWAVAVSGSLARGDACAGSDVDLWAIGPSTGRDERFVGTVPVTVFRDRPAALRDYSWIARWDVERLVVLFDPRGDFLRLRQRYQRHRGAIDRTIAGWTAEAIAARGQLRGGRERILGRREVAWIRFADSVWRATGTRVPHWRDAQALLAPRELERLARAVGLTRRPRSRPRLLRLVKSAPAAVERLLANSFDQRGRVPRWAGVEAKLVNGGWEEAVLKLRADLDSWVAWPLRERRPGIDVAAFLDQAEPTLGRLFRLAHGL